MELGIPRLPQPPGLAYVIRRARRNRNPALEALIKEMQVEVGRYGGLALAG